MAESLGVISAEVRIKLDKLKEDVAHVNTYLNNMQADLKKVENPTDGATKGLKQGFIPAITKAAGSVKIFGVSLTTALGPVGLIIGALVVAFKALSGAVKAVAEAGKKHREVIEKQNAAMAALTGETKTTSAATEEALRRTTAWTAVMERLSSVTSLGTKIINWYKDGLTGLAIAMGIISEAELEANRRLADNEALYNKITDAANTYEKTGNNIDALEQQLIQRTELRAAAEKNAAKERQSANEAYIRQLIEIKNDLMAQEHQDLDAIDAVRYRIRVQTDLLAQQQAANAETAGAAEAVSLLAQAQEQYQKTLAQVQAQERSGYIDNIKAQELRLAAENQYITTLTGLKDEYTALGTLTDEQTAKIKTQTDAHMAQAASIQKVLEYEKKYNNEVARLKTEYEKISAELGVQESFTELMRGETERRTAGLEKQRDAELKELETRYAILEAERGGAGLTEAEIENRDRLTAAINQNYNAMLRLENSRGITAAQQEIITYGKEIGDQYKEITRSLAEQEILQNDRLSDVEKIKAVNELNRAAAIAELDARYAILEAQREELGLTRDEVAERVRLTAEINKNYDALEKAQVSASGNKKESFMEKVIGSDAFKIAEAAVQAYQSVSSAIIEITQRHAQEEISIIEKNLSATLKTINETTKKEIEYVDTILKNSSESLAYLRQVELEEAGFAEAKRAEDMQAAIDAAIAAGDEILQYQLQRRQQELRINNDYDAKEKAAKEQAEADRLAIEAEAQAKREAAESEAARKKADIEYNAAKTKYELDITNAVVLGAMAVTQALAAAPPPVNFALAALSATATGAQMAVILSNPPKMPKFETGGIVPGQNYSAGDTVHAMVSPGELILNRAQQENLAPRLGGGDLTIPIYLDGEKISEVVVNDYINNGRVLIEAKRGIR